MEDLTHPIVFRISKIVFNLSFYPLFTLLKNDF